MMRLHHLVFGLALFAFLGCYDYMLVIDVQGHRGARGYYPENTLEGFQKAIEQGATTLELDVVVSADDQVVVSHEPWLNADICTDLNGNRIEPAQQQAHNLYKMPYADIQRCDCGSLGNPRFPKQVHAKAHKPLLRDVIAATSDALSPQQEPIRYNIEIKREQEMDGVFHPELGKFADLVWHEVLAADIGDRTTLQSFDVEMLQELRRIEPAQTLALLVDEHENYVDKIAELGFYPQILSPWHLLVDERMMQFAAEKNMKVIPWTVNEEADMKRLIDLRVNGIITDYPSILVSVLDQE